MFGSTPGFGNRSSSLFGSTSANTTMGSSGFGGLSTGASATPFGAATTTAQNSQNPNNDIEVAQGPDDTVQALKFNPAVSGSPVFLAAGSWDFTVRVWQVNENGAAEAKAMQNIGAPVLAVDWFDDSSKLFIASADKQARVWDLASNQLTVVGQHDSPIQSCHWITSQSYSCLMTGGWDRTLRFWDMRQLPTQSSLATLQLGERVYCSDVIYPLAVVGLANRQVKSYKLDGTPQEISSNESPLKYQSRAISIFRNKTTNQPAGFALGSIEGRVAIQHVDAALQKDNFTFKCHRSPELVNGAQEIYPINDVKFHPVHNTLATAGGDGRYMFWDKDARTKLKNGEALPKAITRCSIHQSGTIFAYSVGYDWSKGHEANAQPSNARIFLHRCDEDMKPKKR